MQARLKLPPFKLTTKQDQAIKLFGGDAEQILLYGGARSTKTFTILRTIVIRALIAPNSRHAVLRFRFNHVKSSVIFDTFPKMMDLCFPQVTYKLDKSDWYATLPNGSEIWFGGLDDKERVDKILGNEYVSIFLNEISQISYNSYLTVLTRLAQKCMYQLAGEVKEMRLRMFLDMNPPAKGHWSHKLFIEKIETTSRTPLNDKDNYTSMMMNPVDNRENLPESYIKMLENMPKRKRDRFYHGLFQDDTENALWTPEIIDASRLTALPDKVSLVRVVVAVDPSGASDDDNENNDAIGIGVAGLGTDGIGYVLEDLTIKAGPATWGEVAASAYERHCADRVIGEVNYGGAMVEFVLKTANPNISYKAVSASRGKVVRAEPISALHEVGKIKMIGRFDDLEDELMNFTTTGYIGESSPNRADWFVWAFTELFPGIVEERHKHVDIEFAGWGQ